jgi:hypothetical protein
MKKQPNKWLVFSGLAFQIGILMYLMIHLGLWIESKILLPSKLPSILCSSAGLIIIIYLIQKQSKNLNL